ncbi:C25 family cysteine peptidase [Candidatus Bathyarchaeota archaeon]|nr:C25 family cysteine peptidase [Candidatus Bathyarchaeota archaeon]
MVSIERNVGVSGLLDQTQSATISGMSSMVSRRVPAIPLCMILLAQLGFGFVVTTGRPLSRQLSLSQAGRPDVICLMVKDTVYGPLEEKFQRWKTDKEKLGASIVVKIISSESPSQIRSFLKNVTNLAGCLMVGDIPYVEFEWNYSDVYGKQFYDRFPSDLYFMDLSGDWVDSNGNGVYDKILGDLGPEIWVGRLKTSNLSGNEIDLLKHYFDKNHDYLTGALTMPPRALIYVDESTPEATDSATEYYTGELALKTRDALSKIYPEVVLVRSLEYTNASDYLNRLRESWSLVRLNVHSGGFGHYFIYDGKWDCSIHQHLSGSLGL